MSTPAASPAVAELLERWRRLTAPERAAFLVRAWQERWPMPAPVVPVEPEESEAHETASRDAVFAIGSPTSRAKREHP